MAARIPVIDLAGAAGTPAERAAVAAALVDAAVEHGFVYLRSAGEQIPVADVDGAFGVSRKLFALPTADKAACAIGTNNRGWLGIHVETLDPKNQKVGDTKEAFNFAEFVDGQPQQPLPPALAPDVPAVARFFSQCQALCLLVHDLLGIGLGLDPPDFFTAAHRSSAGASSSTLRFLYYPSPSSSSSSSQVPDGVRAGAHSDYGSLTLLFRLAGQAGLEVRTGVDQSDQEPWAPVPVHPPGTEADPAPPILVNIGDLLAYWTGGLLRSTVHRVAFPAVATPGESAADPRYSIAFFCHPAGATPLTPVPSARVAQAVAAQKSAGNGNDSTVLTADEHLQMRLRATYLDLYKA